MSRELRQIRGVLRSVRRRWMWQTIFRCGTNAALSAALVLLAGAVAFRLLDPRTVGALALLEVAIVGTALVSAIRALWPLVHRPSDARVARFIEERCPQLEDRLVTAVECSAIAGTPGMLGDLLYRDAATRTAEIDLDRTISRRSVSAAALTAAISALLLGGVLLVDGPRLLNGATAMRAVMSAGRLVLHVLPGDITVVAGQPLPLSVTITNGTGTTQNRPVLILKDRAGVSRRQMSPTGRPGQFEYGVRPAENFRYSVTAGASASREYQVTVLHPASVTSIDIDYQYPPELGLPARHEEGGGDVYAPPGTRVRLRVHTDKPVRAGFLVINGAARLPLGTGGDRLLTGGFSVSDDATYRISLTDAQNLQNPGDVEYYIRVLADTPPDVKIVAPGSDRQVTPLEEVTIAARAEDDRGLNAFDLVYSVGGRPEVAVPFSTKGERRALDGQRVLYLEDLHVRPGDFVTYYARARDSERGGRSAEARSDMFFLEVRPFEQEFMPPQSSQQASSGGVGGAGRSLEDLVRAQKEIIVATWRLDRRARKSHSAGSQADVKTIARAQGELKSRAQAMAGPAGARAVLGGEAGAEAGDPMPNAVEAMGRAEQSLNQIDTTAALPHETRALNELLKAQASEQRKQLMQARAGAGSDSGPGSADVTTLFDQELKRQQRTNYEMPRGADQREDQKNDALDKVRQMAQRQSELTRQQQDLARNRDGMSDDEVKRQLERLTREQSELRQQAEQLAQQLKRQGGRREASQQAAGGRREAGEQASGGRREAEGDAARMGQVSDAMGQAAANLRDGKLGDASARSTDALDKLRSAEQQMRGSQARAGTRSLGDLQMEAQQLADAQRQIARRTAEAGTGKSAADTMRRLAGEKERLADQVESLASGLKGAAANPGLEGRQRQTIDAVTSDLDRMKLGKQMRDDAAAMRSPEKGDVNRPPSAAGEQELANTLGRLADRLASASGSRDTQRAAEQLGQTRETRDRLARLQQQIDELQRRAATDATDAQGRASPKSAGGKAVGTSGGGTGDQAAELARKQEEYQRELRRAADELNRLRSEAGASGFTPRDAQAQSPLTARGYHQDFSKWEELSREVNAGLENAETALSKKLRDQQARDRLQAPTSGRTPESYRRLIEQYYQSLAKEKR